MSVGEALQKFIKCHEQTQQALTTLKNAVKEEGSKIIQEHIRKESFESATQVINELNKATKIEYNSNVQDVAEYVKSIFGEIQLQTEKNIIQKNPVDSLVVGLVEEEVVEPVKTMQSSGTLDRGYFLRQTEVALKARNFTIHGLNDNRIEISSDNIHYYLTPDVGSFSELDYFKIMDETNNLKSIGFICQDADTLKKAKKAVMAWVEANKSKCKFLSVHLTTLSNIETAAKIFETVSF